METPPQKSSSGISTKLILIAGVAAGALYIYSTTAAVDDEVGPDRATAAPSDGERQGLSNIPIIGPFLGRVLSGIPVVGPLIGQVTGAVGGINSTISNALGPSSGNGLLGNAVNGVPVLGDINRAVTGAVGSIPIVGPLIGRATDEIGGALNQGINEVGNAFNQLGNIFGGGGGGGTAISTLERRRDVSSRDDPAENEF